MSAADITEQIARAIEAEEHEMALVQGESPRPADHAEAHWNGVRHGLRLAARIAREAGAS